MKSPKRREIISLVFICLCITKSLLIKIIFWCNQHWSPHSLRHAKKLSSKKITNWKKCWLNISSVCLLVLFLRINMAYDTQNSRFARRILECHLLCITSESYGYLSDLTVIKWTSFRILSLFNLFSIWLQNEYIKPQEWRRRMEVQCQRLWNHPVVHSIYSYSHCNTLCKHLRHFHFYYEEVTAQAQQYTSHESGHGWLDNWRNWIPHVRWHFLQVGYTLSMAGHDFEPGIHLRGHFYCVVLDDDLGSDSLGKDVFCLLSPKTPMHVQTI